MRLKAVLCKATYTAEFMRATAESKTATPVMASGEPPDHHAALFWDAAGPRLQDMTLVARDGTAVRVSTFVLA